MSDLVKEVAEVVKDKTAPLQDSISKNEKAIKEVYENVQNIIKEQVKKDDVEKMMNDGFKHLSDQNKAIASRNPRETITLKTFSSAVMRSPEVLKNLKTIGESVKNGRSNIEFSIDFKSIAKGLNLYYETVSTDNPNLTNGLTDTNVFDPNGDQAGLTPQERYDFAFDQFFNVLDSSMIRGIELRDTFIFPFINLSRTSIPALRWTEYLPVNPLGFEIVKEGELKPTQDITLSTSKIGSLKIAKHMMFTEEIWEDLPRLENVVFNLLVQEFALKRQDAILNYDSANDLEDGIFLQATPFDVNTVKVAVQDPTILDVITACLVQIETSTNYDFGATSKNVNFVGMNPLDYGYLFMMKKDGENNSQTLAMFDMLQRMGISIVTDLAIPEGKILIGDLKKYNVWEYQPYSVRFGLVNDQFIHNQFTIVAEGRHMQGMSVLDRKNIIFDDIAVIQQALSDGPVVTP